MDLVAMPDTTMQTKPDIGPRSRELNEEFVEAGGMRFRVQATGEGKPVVDLRVSHAPAVSALASVLAEHCRVISIHPVDAPPTGQDGQSVAKLRAAMSQAIAKLDIGDFSVLGRSDDAGLALWLGLIRPNAVKGAILVAPTALGTAMADAELAERLPELQAKVLALFGTRDAISPPTMGRRYREKISHCHLVFVYGAGHDIDNERPAATAAVVREFLERHEQFIVSTKSGRIYP